MRRILDFGWERIAGATLVLAGLCILVPATGKWYTSGQALLASILLVSGVFVHQLPEHTEAHYRYQEWLGKMTEEERIANEGHEKRMRALEWLMFTIGIAAFLMLAKYMTLYLRL